MKQDAKKDMFKPALEINEEHWRGVVDGDDFQLPKPETLKRIANRFRQGTRPKEPSPTDNMFEVSKVTVKTPLKCLHVKLLRNVRYLSYATLTLLRIFVTYELYVCVTFLYAKHLRTNVRRTLRYLL